MGLLCRRFSVPLGRERIEEFRYYRREDGLIVKERDDLISSTRYAIMIRCLPSRGGSRSSNGRHGGVISAPPDASSHSSESYTML